MKKILFFTILLTSIIWSQSGRIQVFKGSAMTNNYIPIATDTNKIENSQFYIDANVALNVPIKMLLDSLYTRTGELYIEGVKFSNQNIDLPGALTMYGDAVFGGFMNLNMLDTNWYGSKITDEYILQFDADSSKWIPVANSGGGSSLTEEEVEDYVGGMLGGTETRISVTYQDGTNDIDFIVDDMNQDTTYLRNDIDSNTSDISDNADSITAHRGELNTLNGYVDQDVSTDASPSHYALTINQSADNVGLQVNGYDDRSGAYLKSYITDDGYSALDVTAGLMIKRLGTNKALFYTSFLKLFDNYPIVLGTGAEFQFIYDDATDDRLELSDGTNDFLTVTDAGTDADFNFIGRIESDGYKINTHTITGDSTISASDMYGGVFYVTSAATLTLPAVTSGMNITVITIGAIAVSVDPNASDKLVLDGTTLDDGDKATNTSTTGDMIVLTYYSADGWYAASDGWTDGGA